MFNHLTCCTVLIVSYSGLKGKIMGMAENKLGMGGHKSSNNQGGGGDSGSGGYGGGDSGSGSYGGGDSGSGSYGGDSGSGGNNNY